MKKTLLFITLLASATLTKAQALKDIELLTVTNRFAEAKPLIDKFIADPKNAKNTSGFYYQGKIYNGMSKDATLAKADAYNNKIASFAAFKKYLELDKKATLLTEDKNFAFLDLYAGFSDLGIASFNDKNFGDAFNSFVKAQEVEDFIFEKGYTYTELKLNKLDTNLVMNTSAAALNNKDTATALKLYHKLVDAKLSAPAYEGIYDFLVSYYFDKQDSKNFLDITNKAKTYYGSNTYWSEKELLFLSKTDKNAMFAKYDEIYTKGPAVFSSSYNYAVEMYNVLYDRNNPKKDSVVSNKLIKVLKSTIPVDKDNSANMLLSNHLYNLAADYSEASDKLTKPADAAKKKNLIALSMAKLKELIPYAENSVVYFKSLATLKLDQKVNYKSTAGYLAEAYRNAKNLAKTTEYEKLAASIQIK